MNIYIDLVSECAWQTATCMAAGKQLVVRRGISFAKRREAHINLCIENASKCFLVDGKTIKQITAREALEWVTALP